MANDVKKSYMPSTMNRIGTGLGTLGQGILGYSNAKKEGAAAGRDAMASAFNVGVEDVDSRASKYQDRMNDIYTKVGNRPNLFRTNSQENNRASMLRSYLGNYGGNIGQLRSMVPSQEDLQKRQLEDLRNLSFQDATYMPSDMFSEYYGTEGQSNLGQELGLPMNGLMQSGASGGRGLNRLQNEEFNSGITNRSIILNQIQQELAKKASDLSKTTMADKFGFGTSLLSAILSMAKPTMLG